MGFMREKPHPFPNALVSKKHFNRIQVWRKGYIAVGLLKNVLEVPCNSHWYNYGYQSYKFTKSVFETYCENDSLVWTKCDLYDSIPSDVITASSKTTPVKKRSRSSFEVDTPEAPRVVKTICLLTDSSEESSEEGGD